ncbi:disulfide bond formation protein B [Bordetella bronchiseptica]
MIFLRNPGRGSRIVNTLVLLAVSLLLLSALAWQWLDGQAPCPLCLLQRAALVLIGVGLLLNVRMGPSPLHYAMVLAPALGGLAAAGWQLLSPEAGAAPPPWQGWAFLLFGAMLVYCTLMLAADRKWGDNALKKPVALPGALVMGLFLVAVLANAAGTVL